MSDLDYIKQLSIIMFATEDFSKYDSPTIVQLLTTADDLYHNGQQSFLTDKQYDKLYRYLQLSDPTNTYLNKIGAPERSGKVLLPYKMGSLTQAYEGDIQKWIEKYDLQNEELVLTDKLDGTSALLIYEKKQGLTAVYSRGDGTKGANILRHFQYMDVPKNVDKFMEHNIWAIRAEVIFEKDKFWKFKDRLEQITGKEYKNPRNCVAGLMNSKEVSPEILNQLSVVAYSFLDPIDIWKSKQLDLLNGAGFETAEMECVSSNNINDMYLTKYVIDRKNNSKYELDGIVIDIENAKLRMDINPTKDTLNPEYARKYKVSDESNIATAKVKDVEWNISKDGYLKPTVLLEPVELGGVTIQRATGFNAKFVLENRIGFEAEVDIVRSGDVIPYILNCSKYSNDKILPDENIIGGKYKWNDTEVDLVLINPDIHPEVIFQRILYFFESLNTEGLKEQTLRKLYNNGFNTIESILSISEKELAENINSDINASKIIDNFKKRFDNIPLYEIMGATSFFGRGAGVRKLKKLYKEFKGDLTKFTFNNIVNVYGFDITTAEPIAEGIEKFELFLNEIQKNDFIKIEEFKHESGSWSGQKVVFTGFRNKDFEKKIESLGGEIVSSVSKKTTLLVANDVNENSGKLNKARELGIKIVSGFELGSML